jgi:hypothetical protein
VERVIFIMSYFYFYLSPFYLLNIAIHIYLDSHVGSVGSGIGKTYPGEFQAQGILHGKELDNSLSMCGNLKLQTCRP